MNNKDNYNNKSSYKNNNRKTSTNLNNLTLNQLPIIFCSKIPNNMEDNKKSNNCRTKTKKLTMSKLIIFSIKYIYI